MNLLLGALGNGNADSAAPVADIQIISLGPGGPQPMGLEDLPPDIRHIVRHDLGL